MAKDPAFLFYPNDWIGGTMGMTFEEKGAYVELLMYQFNRGHMTKHMISRMIGHLWVNLEVKFRTDKEGLYYNERLDFEKEKRKKYAESRRNNVSGKNQHSNKSGHMTSHMENVNINENETSNKVVFNTKPTSKNFNGLPEIKNGAAIELIRITQQADVTKKDVDSLWEVFKIQHLNGENYYASEEKVYTHFISWSKTQKINNGKSSNGNTEKLGTSAQRLKNLKDW